jgi:DNA topoisomerase IA
VEPLEAERWRVQSGAAAVVERERDSYLAQEYWSIHADLAKPIDHTQHFLARLIQIGTQKVGLDQPIQQVVNEARRAQLGINIKPKGKKATTAGATLRQGMIRGVRATH